MLAEIEAAGNQHDAAIHRRWTGCDVKVMQAWLSGRYQCGTESWREFRDRITGCGDLLACAPDERLIVFTSATPIGVWCALGMDIFDERAMRLAGALFNSSVSVLDQHEGIVRMRTFNGVPHLATPEMHTRR